MAQERMSVRFSAATAWCATAAMALAGCAPKKGTDVLSQRPDVRPAHASEPGEVLELGASHIQPMYTELVAIDLPTVVHAATAQNFDIRRAREAVKASRGKLESAVGAIFPAFVPTALFNHVEGTVRATEGNLVGVGFNTFQGSLAVQWVINPGRVINDIIAARKRLAASEHQEDAMVCDTLRRAVVQYYDLVLAQARVSATHQSVAEAMELSRITDLRIESGVGVQADALRAEARLAGRRQDLVSAMKTFYDASIVLTVTLHLDASVTLAPKIDRLPAVHLVRDDLSIDELLDIAVANRPDLEQIRLLVEAAIADKGATWWGAFGPQFSVGYDYGGITGHANNIRPVRNGRGFEDQTFSFSDQQRGGASTEWRLSVAAFGNLKTAGAIAQGAVIESERKIDVVRSEVVMTAQASRANHELVGLARHQIDAAAEALRLIEANLQAGTMTTLDVLQAQDAATQARLRHAEAVVHYNQSQIELLAAIGLIDENALLGATDAGAQGAAQSADAG